MPRADTHGAVLQIARPSRPGQRNSPPPPAAVGRPVGGCRVSRRRREEFVENSLKSPRRADDGSGAQVPVGRSSLRDASAFVTRRGGGISLFPTRTTGRRPWRHGGVTHQSTAWCPQGSNPESADTRACWLMPGCAKYGDEASERGRRPRRSCGDSRPRRRRHVRRAVEAVPRAPSRVGAARRSASVGLTSTWMRARSR